MADRTSRKEFADEIEALLGFRPTWPRLRDREKTPEHPVAAELGEFRISVYRRAGFSPAELEALWAGAVDTAALHWRLPAMTWRTRRAPWNVSIPLSILVAGLDEQEPPCWHQAMTLTLPGFAFLVRSIAYRRRLVRVLQVGPLPGLVPAEVDPRSARVRSGSGRVPCGCW